MSNEATVAEVEETAEVKASKIRFRDFKKKGWPFLSLEKAKARRWARVSDGAPTKIYLHALARVQAEKKGIEIPKRPRKAAPEQFHADLQSPYDLRRRSGYKTIWMVLAENAGEFVSHDDLKAEVNNRLAVDPTDKNGWYEKNFASKDDLYDTYKNSIVIARAPYNGIDVKTGDIKEVSIEGLGQRVILDAVHGVKLLTEVTEPRDLKKRGRKAKPTNEVVEDNDESITIEAEETVSETVQA